MKISDLIPDDKNFNKGSEFGNSLIEKSLRKFGAGRSILIDKNNKIIAGNKTIENAGAVGLDDVHVVESDGKKIIAVRRNDIDLDTPEGRELALADNATAKASISWDDGVMVGEDYGFDPKEWGVDLVDLTGISGAEDNNQDDYIVFHRLSMAIPAKTWEISHDEIMEKISNICMEYGAELKKNKK